MFFSCSRIDYNYIKILENSVSTFMIQHQFPEASYEVEEDSAMAGLVAKEFGIAIMSKIPILDMMDVKVVPILEPKIKCYIYLVKMKNKYLSPVAQEFVKYVIKNQNI